MIVCLSFSILLLQPIVIKAFAYPIVNTYIEIWLHNFQFLLSRIENIYIFTSWVARFPHLLTNNKRNWYIPIFYYSLRIFWAFWLAYYASNQYPKFEPCQQWLPCLCVWFLGKWAHTFFLILIYRHGFLEYNPCFLFGFLFLLQVVLKGITSEEIHRGLGSIGAERQAMFTRGRKFLVGCEEPKPRLGS